jgi:hypothetical protein
MTVGDSPASMLRFNGKAWSRQPSPRTSALLQAVSCSSRHACLAVGEMACSCDGGPYAFVEHWNGLHWTIVPADTGSALNSVSCSARRFCVVAGDGGLVWNGSRLVPTQGTRVGEVLIVKAGRKVGQ